MNDIGNTVKIRVLCFIDYYYPGYRAGGPMRTIKNMVVALAPEIDFHIFTRDRDLGATIPYEGLHVDAWNQIGPAKVFYASPRSLTITKIYQRLKTEHDILYLNSFFSTYMSIFPLFLRWLKLYRGKIILAPRGEFSPGALAIKPLRKKIFIMLSRWLGLHKQIIWHASSEKEAQDIKEGYKNNISVSIAMNLPALYEVRSIERPERNELMTKLRLIFLSRISPKKNLLFALQVLQKFPLPVIFDLYGPIEDANYWKKCQATIRTMPENISVTYKGLVAHEDVVDLFSQYDLFFFPTLGENYGHVIAEALIAGTPVLISDQTPWDDLAEHGVGWPLPLDKEEPFCNVLTEMARHPFNEAKRKSVQAYARKKLHDSELVAANLDLFRKSL